MESLVLHQMHRSGNCYKIRLTASIIGLKLTLKEWDLLNGATRTPEFLVTVNANGRLPVLQIGNENFLPESGAACYYLADVNDSYLVPKDRLEHAKMLQWMFFEQYSHEPALAVLRFWRLFKGVENLTDVEKALMPQKEKQAEDVLDLMNQHLAETTDGWFVGSTPSLADISLFAYTHDGDRFGFDLTRWPKVKEWCNRVKEIDGFISLEDLH